MLLSAAGGERPASLHSRHGEGGWDLPSVPGLYNHFTHCRPEVSRLSKPSKLTPSFRELRKSTRLKLKEKKVLFIFKETFGIQCPMESTVIQLSWNGLLVDSRSVCSKGSFQMNNHIYHIIDSFERLVICAFNAFPQRTFRYWHI